MTYRAVFRQPAYQKGLEAANAAVPQSPTMDMDRWWEILKEVEAAEMARLCAEEDATTDEEDATTDEEDQTVVSLADSLFWLDDSIEEQGGWAAYTADYYAPLRWSAVHFFEDHASDRPICGMHARPGVEWATEDEASSSGRCKHCEAALQRRQAETG